VKLRRTVAAVLSAALVLLAGYTVHAQVSRPFRNGSVWTLAFIRMTPGMENAYLSYIATDWKKAQEAAKKEGLILSYKVLTTEGHNPNDFNIILMTEHKDLATMEANQAKADALAQRVVGDDQKQQQGYKERMDRREIVGDRIAREIVLEPRP
jgi:hypothetical protein